MSGVDYLCHCSMNLGWGCVRQFLKWHGPLQNHSKKQTIHGTKANSNANVRHLTLLLCRLFFRQSRDPTPTWRIGIVSFLCLYSLFWSLPFIAVFGRSTMEVGWTSLMETPSLAKRQASSIIQTILTVSLNCLTMTVLVMIHAAQPKCTYHNLWFANGHANYVEDATLTV